MHQLDGGSYRLCVEQTCTDSRPTGISSGPDLDKEIADCPLVKSAQPVAS